MRIKFLLLSLLVSFLIQFSTLAEKVNIEKAKIVAGNFFTEKMPKYNQALQYGNEFVITNHGIPVYYVFNLNDGYIIISADDAVSPVLGYSFTNNYTGNNLPPAFEFWMSQYEKQILFAIEKKSMATKSVKDVWLEYSSESFVPDLDLEGVEPMLQTTWSQGCYYNSHFPTDSTAPCGHLWTGCVATAMGQIMKYYNFPQSGTGSYGYNSSYGWVEADFENTEYHWAGMQNNLAEENDAVAELLYHAAVSINSQFYPNGTGAFDFDARDALVEYFNYKSDAQFYWRDDYQGDWKTMLREELDAGRPFLYGGADSQTSAGHTLVCDGYQDTAFFHFNWGWNGNYDGYYYLDSLSASGSHFDIQHDAVVGIKPDINGTSEIGSATIFNVYPNPASDLINIHFRHMTSNTLNCSLSDLNGRIVCLKTFKMGIDVTARIEVPEVTKGVYLLTVASGSDSYSVKILIDPTK